MIKCGITGARGVLGKKIRKNLPYKFYIFNKDITNKKEVKKWIDKSKIRKNINFYGLLNLMMMKGNTSS